MSQSGIASTIAAGGGGTTVTSVTGANGVTAVPTTGAVVVSGVNATTSTVGVASYNPADFTVVAGAVSIIGGPAIAKLTSQAGVATATGGNINVFGTTLYNTSASGNTISVNPNINAFPITPYVVGPVGQAGYQTIQSGLNAANAAGGGSVYVQAGAYTENLVFYPDVQIVGVTGNSDETAVGTDITIAGQHTPPMTGYTTISNVYLTNTSDIFFSTAAGAAAIALQNCNVAISGTGYTFNLVNWTGELFKYDVQDNSVNNGVVNNTAGATCFFQNSNMGAGTSSPMITSGSITMKRVDLNCPWTLGAGTVIIADFAVFLSTITFNGTAGGALNLSRLSPAQGSGGQAIIWNSSTILELEGCVIDSTATYAIDGAGTGTITLGGITFVEGSTFNPTLPSVVGVGAFLPGDFATAGQVFTSNGPKIVPTFQNLPAVVVPALNYTNVNHAASPYTVLSTDQYISVDCSAGVVTLRFPNAPTAERQWIVKDRTGSSSTNNISLTTVGGTVTIDGQTTYTIDSNYGAIQMLANATTYEVF